MRTFTNVDTAGNETFADTVARPNTGSGSACGTRSRLRFSAGVGTEPKASVAEDIARLVPDAALARALVPDVSLQVERRRVAILVTDVVGYSRLIEIDDLGTALRVRHFRQHILVPTTHAHHGWIANFAGDSTVMVFSRSVEAVKCAIAIQRALSIAERETAADHQIRVHMGISAGDTVTVDGELHGHAVNVAFRLQSLAEPGHVYLSDEVFGQVNGVVAVQFEALGKRDLRNIAKPIHIYRVATSELAP
jgi:class 3 adenylate cyclase